MVINTQAFSIFRTGSKTFFTASLFFPKKVRDDVFDLYAFVRMADNFVDVLPQKKAEYEQFKEDYRLALSGERVSSEVINRFVTVQKNYNFEQSWVNAFFASMDMDLNKQSYDTLEDLLVYIYGSAEVIGLMMAKLMNLDPNSYGYAAVLGRAFQYMNMIRDIDEDLAFGRTYLPKQEIEEAGLKNLSKQEATQNPDKFNNFMFRQISLYKSWRQEAEKGFKYIPKRYRLPIQAAAESFDETIKEIEKQPLLVYEEKVRSSRRKIIWSMIKQLI